VSAGFFLALSVGKSGASPAHGVGIVRAAGIEEAAMLATQASRVPPRHDRVNV
jgi:hypothetical protein